MENEKEIFNIEEYLEKLSKMPELALKEEWDKVVKPINDTIHHYRGSKFRKEKLRKTAGGKVFE